MKVLLLALALAVSPACAEDDGKLTIDIPSSVQATIARERGDKGKVVSFQKVNETDGTTYVVGLQLDGKKYELALDAAGRVMHKALDHEDTGPKTMKMAALPEKVRETIQREAGAGVVDEIEEQEAKTTYVTEVVIAQRKYRIEVAADGTLLKKEYAGPEEEKEK
jgi:hypothetical protein